MLFIKINFSNKYILIFPINKVIVVLKLALLASHMDKYVTVLIENAMSGLTNIDASQTLTVALFNMCFVFYIVFVKRIIVDRWRVPVSQVPTLDPHLHLLQLIPHN